MNKTFLPQYNLDITLLGGQSFNWDFCLENKCFYGFTKDKVIKLKKDGDNLFWQTYPEKDDFNYLKTYLKLAVDYPNILKKIQKDKYIKSAIRKHPNIRLLKQDFEQTLLSFLISSNNNIRSIRTIIRSLSQRFGSSITIDDKKIFLFPETESIATAKLEELLNCKLGFRAKFLKAAASYLIQANIAKDIQMLSENEARGKLKEIKGIGDKIADCILVFSLGFDNVTPFDIWGKRILTRFYKLSPKMKYSEMRIWAANYFNGYSGWAGQFLYEYIRDL